MKIINKWTVGLLALSLPMVALAQLAGPPTKLPKSGETVLATGLAGGLDTLNTIANWMFSIFLVVAVLIIMYAAFKYLTSGGGEETAKVHKMIIWAVVAIAVAFLARSVTFIVGSIVAPKVDIESAATAPK